MNYSYPYMGNYSPINPYTPQQQTPQMPQNLSQNAAFVCRPVTSREEAVAVQADYFGPGTLMPDLGHGIIYLKRFNPNTGASDFVEFRLAVPEEPKPAPEYVTRQEFEEFVNRIKPKGKKTEVADE